MKPLSLDETIALADNTTFGCGPFLARLFGEAQARGISPQSVVAWHATHAGAGVSAVVAVRNGTDLGQAVRGVLDAIAELPPAPTTPRAIKDLLAQARSQQAAGTASSPTAAAPAMPPGGPAPAAS
jgi:hypothetical protein